MNWRYGAGTDPGRRRSNNEDSYLVREPLFAVADGIGGHNAGEVASTLAIDELRNLVDRGSSYAHPEQAAEALEAAIRHANTAILQRGEEDPACIGMGTTVTAVLLTANAISVAHVGDSRAYLLRDGTLLQLTEDHSEVQQLVNEGALSQEEAFVHPYRHIITNALGLDRDLQVDTQVLETRAGDRLLLCSDGLSDVVRGDVIRDVLRHSEDPRRAASHLVRAANGAGGPDNVTVLTLFEVSSDHQHVVVSRPA